MCWKLRQNQQKTNLFSLYFQITHQASEECGERSLCPSQRRNSIWWCTPALLAFMWRPRPPEVDLSQLWWEIIVFIINALCCEFALWRIPHAQCYAHLWKSICSVFFSFCLFHLLFRSNVDCLNCLLFISVSCWRYFVNSLLLFLLFSWSIYSFAFCILFHIRSDHFRYSLSLSLSLSPSVCVYVCMYVCMYLKQWIISTKSWCELTFWALAFHKRSANARNVSSIHFHGV